MKITVCELTCAVQYTTDRYTGREVVDYFTEVSEFYYDKNEAFDRLRELAADFSKLYTPSHDFSPIDDRLRELAAVFPELHTPSPDFEPIEIGEVKVFLVDIPDDTVLPSDPENLLRDWDDNGNDIDPVVECFMDFPIIEVAEAYEDGSIKIH